MTHGVEQISELHCSKCGTKELVIHKHESGEFHVQCPKDNIVVYIHSCDKEKN
jgi:hypothetical protein